ncbi:Ribokinase [Maioricimonas rarisocia]|uniref:Ribokinase n=1 Tax=Maioricimonas rarisocia TaxID=2528026 RepID=A0A517ZFD4_9PLAN|nr:ribokinase [Maioricimonas rarisocia]QDU41188.1 Ribokinase [Maioricimonas rarisocia]
MTTDQTAGPSPRIAVVGSINMDLVVRCERLPRPGETIIGLDAREVSGGKGANQAVAAARLGASVSMVGRVGSDGFGETLLGSLQAEGIHVGHVARTPDCSSGLAIVAVETSGENAITVVPGANGRLSVEDVRAASDVIEAADVLLLQLEVPTETVIAASQIARAAGTRVILDPAPAPTAVPEGLLAVDLLCPNESEAAALNGLPVESDDDLQAAARRLAEISGAEVIITLGDRGALLHQRDGQSVRVPAFPCTAVDTTAAGDAFAGALALRLAEGTDVPEAIRFANAAGAIAASRHGAQPGMPTRNDVEQLMADPTQPPSE